MYELATPKQLTTLYQKTGKKLELRKMALSKEDAAIFIRKSINGENIEPLLIDYGATYIEEIVSA